MSMLLHGVGVWNNFRRVWGIFSSNTRFEVGDGVNFRFGMICGVGTRP
jgi:hypothetical protein